jgi:SAM-dependent methyltransferase
MSDWNPSEQYRAVLEANRRHYASHAITYEATETHINDPYAQAMLESDLDRALRQFGKPTSEIRALDACGGSGTAAIKLLERGVGVTVCDASEQLLTLCKQNCADRNLEATTVCADIGEFLVSTPEEWDLIVFSSALHHIEDIKSIMQLTIGGLAPGGLLFTVFDPTSGQGKLARTLMRLDFLVFKIHRQSGDIPTGLKRRFRRMTDSRYRRAVREIAELDDANNGIMAEYHVECGIDDRDLVEFLIGMGLELIRHDRYPGARYRLNRLLLSLFGQVTAFKLLMRRPAEG